MFEDKEERLPDIPKQVTTMEAVTTLLTAQTEGKMDNLTLLCTLGLINLFSILNLLNNQGVPLQSQGAWREGPSSGMDPMSLLLPLFSQLQAQQGKGDGSQKPNPMSLLLPLLATQMGGGGKKPNINALMPLLKLMASQAPQPEKTVDTIESTE